MEAHPGTIKAQPRTVETYHRAVEAHTGGGGSTLLEVVMLN
jgi:hypothetical protein